MLARRKMVAGSLLASQLQLEKLLQAQSLVVSLA
jgi:hypothetical protein